MKRRTVCTLLLAVSLGLTGCSSEESQTAPAAEAAYPLNAEVELSYYLAESIVPYAYNDLPLKKSLETATGVKINFIQPYGSPYSYLDLMIASDELPDLMESDWNYYTRGAVGSLISDQVILPLNQLIESDSPNLRAYLEENPDIAVQLRTYDGSYYMYPFVREDEKMTGYMGTMVRKDLLDERGLPLPETVGEWETVLTAFSEAGLSVPMSYGFNNMERYYRIINPIIGAFGIMSDFYVEDGKIQYGEYRPEFADYIRKIADWYQRGLIDPLFYDQDLDRRIQELVQSCQIGAVTANAGGYFGRWIPYLAEHAPNVKFAPVKYAAPQRGQRSVGGGKELRCYGLGTVITAQCKNPEIAARFLDYGYSEEGHMFYNFGNLGDTYTMIDGYPTYTERVTDYRASGASSLAAALKQYTRGSSFGPFVQDMRYLEQYYQLPEQKQALEVWGETDARQHLVPLLALTEEEGKRLNRIVQDADAYLGEAIYDLIVSGVDAAALDDYYSTLKALGIEEAISIKQAAYDRYLERSMKK